MTPPTPSDRPGAPSAPRTGYSRPTIAVSFGVVGLLLSTCLYGTCTGSIDADREAEAFFHDCMDPATAARCKHFTAQGGDARLARLRDEYSAACGPPTTVEVTAIHTRSSVYSTNHGWFWKRYTLGGLVHAERCVTEFELEFDSNGGEDVRATAIRHDSRPLAVGASAVSGTARTTTDAPPVQPPAAFRPEAAAASPEPTSTEPTSPDTRLIAKLRPYVDCIDVASDGALFSTTAYLRALPRPTDDPAAAPDAPRVASIGSVRPCLEGLAVDVEPDDPDLEALGSAYADALTILAPLVEEAHAYYTDQDYRDDGWARGRRMHPDLLAAADAFRDADDAMRSAVRIRHREWRERELTRLAATDARTLGWHQQRAFLLAARVMDSGDVGLLSSFELDLDERQFGAAIEDLTLQVAALDRYAADHGEDVDPPWGRIHLDAFRREVDAFVRAAKEMLRRRRDGRRFTDTELDDLARRSGDSFVQGGVPKLQAAYRSVVRAARTLGVAA